MRTEHLSTPIIPPTSMEQTTRTHLPGKTTKNELGIWSVLKSCVGKDLTKITIPVQFNEPLSFLQRISEALEYSQLLSVESSDPVQRIETVTGFAVSALASNVNRLGKPFNPLVGETYELERNGWKFVAEQVSHHPPISAFHAESDLFVFQGWIYPKLKLWGKSVEVHPKGTMSLFLKKFKETYTWSNVYCSVHNVIVGKLWIEHHGSMDITCAETGLKVNLHFKPAGWFNNELHRVEGFLTDNTKKKLRFVYGKWTESIWSTDIESYDEYIKSNAHKFRLGEPSTTGADKKSPCVSPKPAHKIFQKFNSISIRSFSTSVEGSCNTSGEELSPESQEDLMPKSDGENLDIPNSTLLWEVEHRPDYAAEYYHFTLFAMSLNQILPNKLYCPTDSRLRPDIRKLEEADLEAAATWKHQLEEKQRKALKAKHEQSGNPNWFEKKGDLWEFSGKYWSQAIKTTADSSQCAFA